jgi:transcriptional regulator with XRE-family HTH domain
MGDTAMIDAEKAASLFAERLREVREKRGLTQVELGTKAGIPGTSIAHMEAGSRKPSFDSLCRLVTALEVTTDYLLGRVDEAKTVQEGDALFRDAEHFSGDERRLLKDCIHMLKNRGGSHE